MLEFVPNEALVRLIPPLPPVIPPLAVKVPVPTAAFQSLD